MKAAPGSAWRECRFLTCSVLPVRMACNCDCRFCFSKSSVSALERPEAGTPDGGRLVDLDLERYFLFARARGATRAVVTGGGEPLLRKDWTVQIVERARRFFSEVALFTNAALLTGDLARRLAAAGLSYLCYSRHHFEDRINRELMGSAAPDLERALAAAAAGPLPVRATCVMARGYVDSRDAVMQYVDTLAARGVRQFTFKHTYVAYPGSVFAGSSEDHWAARHRVELDPFGDGGGDPDGPDVVARLPWGPAIRRLGDLSLCYYWEPTPRWEEENRLCRSINLLSDGMVYASLEETRSLLFRLAASPRPSPSAT